MCKWLFNVWFSTLMPWFCINVKNLTSKNLMFCIISDKCLWPYKMIKPDLSPSFLPSKLKPWSLTWLRALFKLGIEAWVYLLCAKSLVRAFDPEPRLVPALCPTHHTMLPSRRWPKPPKKTGSRRCLRTNTKTSSVWVELTTEANFYWSTQILDVSWIGLNFWVGSVFYLHFVCLCWKET